MRQRWFGATGQRVPEIVADGDEAISLENALVLESVSDLERLQKAHEEGTPWSCEPIRPKVSRPRSPGPKSHACSFLRDDRICWSST